MLTLEKAKTLSYGDVLCDNAKHGSDGMHVRWRVSGQVKTWKRDPARIRVPLKHGLYDYSALTESDFFNGECSFMTFAKDCDCGNT